MNDGRADGREVGLYTNPFGVGDSVVAFEGGDDGRDDGTLVVGSDVGRDDGHVDGLALGWTLG